MFVFVRVLEYYAYTTLAIGQKA